MFKEWLKISSGILGILVLLCILLGSLNGLVWEQLVQFQKLHKSLDDTEESEDVYSWIMRRKKAGVLPSSPRYPSCSISPGAPSIEPAREYRAPSDTSWSVVALARPSCSVSPVSLLIDPAGEYILVCSWTGHSVVGLARPCCSTSPVSLLLDPAGDYILTCSWTGQSVAGLARPSFCSWQ